MGIKKSNKIIISIVSIFLGWIIEGLAWGTRMMHQLNTICFFLGLVLFFGGLIFLITSFKK